MELSRTIETENGEMIVKRVSVPLGLEELMEGLAKEVILKKPKDLYVFASDYFAKLLELRETKCNPVKTSIRFKGSVVGRRIFSSPVRKTPSTSPHFLRTKEAILVEKRKGNIQKHLRKKRESTDTGNEVHVVRNSKSLVVETILNERSEDITVSDEIDKKIEILDLKNETRNGNENDPGEMKKDQDYSVGTGDKTGEIQDKIGENFCKSENSFDEHQIVDGKLEETDENSMETEGNQIKSDISQRKLKNGQKESVINQEISERNSGIAEDDWEKSGKKQEELRKNQENVVKNLLNSEEEHKENQEEIVEDTVEIQRNTGDISGNSGKDSELEKDQDESEGNQGKTDKNLEKSIENLMESKDYHEKSVDIQNNSTKNQESIDETSQKSDGNQENLEEKQEKLKAEMFEKNEERTMPREDETEENVMGKDEVSNDNSINSTNGEKQQDSVQNIIPKNNETFGNELNSVNEDEVEFQNAAEENTYDNISRNDKRIYSQNAKEIEEVSAKKIQAAFRGFQARQRFRTVKSSKRNEEFMKYHRSDTIEVTHSLPENIPEREDEDISNSKELNENEFSDAEKRALEKIDLVKTTDKSKTKFMKTETSESCEKVDEKRQVIKKNRAQSQKNHAEDTKSMFRRTKSQELKNSKKISPRKKNAMRVPDPIMKIPSIDDNETKTQINDSSGGQPEAQNMNERNQINSSLCIFPEQKLLEKTPRNVKSVDNSPRESLEDSASLKSDTIDRENCTERSSGKETSNGNIAMKELEGIPENTKTNLKFLREVLKIQAAWRAYQTRRNMRQNVERNEINDEGNGNRSVNLETLRAVTKIQAGFRGYLERTKRKKREIGEIIREDNEQKVANEKPIEYLQELDKLPIPETLPRDNMENGNDIETIDEDRIMEKQLETKTSESKISLVANREEGDTVDFGNREKIHSPESKKQIQSAPEPESKGIEEKEPDTSVDSIKKTMIKKNQEIRESSSRIEKEKGIESETHEDTELSEPTENQNESLQILKETETENEKNMDNKREITESQEKNSSSSGLQDVMKIQDRKSSSREYQRIESEEKNTSLSDEQRIEIHPAPEKETESNPESKERISPEFKEMSDPNSKLESENEFQKNSDFQIETVPEKKSQDKVEPASEAKEQIETTSESQKKIVSFSKIEKEIITSPEPREDLDSSLEKKNEIPQEPLDQEKPQSVPPEQQNDESSNEMLFSSKSHEKSASLVKKNLQKSQSSPATFNQGRNEEQLERNQISKESEKTPGGTEDESMENKMTSVGNLKEELENQGESTENQERTQGNQDKSGGNKEKSEQQTHEKSVDTEKRSREEQEKSMENVNSGETSEQNSQFPQRHSGEDQETKQERADLETNSNCSDFSIQTEENQEEVAPSSGQVYVIIQVLKS